jgi:uncharacterized metal-binding protein YceD (DUF177 family)
VTAALPLPEFSRPWDLRQIDDRPVRLEANEQERAALAQRFEIIAIGTLTATLTLERQAEVVHAHGTLHAEIVQACAVSGEDLKITIEEPLALRFAPESSVENEELELAADDLDEMAYSGTVLDLGEAVAQSLGLAIDPYAVGPDAERVRREAGLLDEGSSGPFAALAALRKK